MIMARGSHPPAMWSWNFMGPCDVSAFGVQVKGGKGTGHQEERRGRRKEEEKRPISSREGGMDKLFKGHAEPDRQDLQCPGFDPGSEARWIRNASTIFQGNVWPRSRKEERNSEIVHLCSGRCSGGKGALKPQSLEQCRPVSNHHRPP